MSPNLLLRCTAIAVVALLAGCETMTMSLGKKIEYKSSGTAPALEIPGLHAVRHLVIMEGGYG